MTTPNLIDRILRLSRADDCIVIAEQSSAVNLRWANNTATTNGSTTDRELIIIAIRGRRTGTVHRRYVNEDRLEDLVREAEAACDFQQPTEDYAQLEPGAAPPADWAAPVDPTSISVFADTIRDLATAFGQFGARQQLLFGYAEHTSSTTWLANSRGLRRRHDQRQGQIELTAKTADFTTSAWTGQTTRDFTDVNLPALAAQLQQRLEWSRTHIDLPAGRYDTLLEPSAVADLLIYAYWTAAARDAAEGRTVFSQPGGHTKIGQRLTPVPVTLYSDPHEPGLAVAPFEITGSSSSYASLFDNGTPLARTDWIDRGTLQHLITPRYWAARQHTPATPYIDNLILDAGGTDSLDDMIRHVKRGLLVTCLWYIREVDPQRLLLTGLTRDGVFLIENGQVQGAVNNFRFNLSPVEMLSTIQAAGATGPTLAREWGDYFTFAKMPPLLIADFNMSSVSQAT